MCSIAGAAVAAAAACNEYDSSLLSYSDSGLDSSDAAQTLDAADASGELAPDAAQPDAQDGEDAADDVAQDAALDGPGPCTATRLDCDGDETNGCEVDSSSDPRSCGACGHDCLLGECWSGVCQPFVLATGQTLPSNVALDSTHLYWTNQQPGGAVSRVPRSGGPVEVVAQLSLAPGGIAVDDTAVFWSEFASAGSVWRLDKSSIGDTTAAVELASGQGTSTALALDGNRVYWTTPGTIRRTFKTGGSVETIASGQETPGGLVAQLGLAFWTNVMGGTVVGLDTNSDGGVHVFATGQGFPAGLTADLGNLYWANNVADTDGGSPAIMTIAKLNVTTPTVLAGGQAGPLGIAQFGTHIYWTNNGGGTVMRVLKTGGTPEVLASGQQAPAGIAVDATAVFWVNRDDGTVAAVAQ